MVQKIRNLFFSLVFLGVFQFAFLYLWRNGGSFLLLSKENYATYNGFLFYACFTITALVCLFFLIWGEHIRLKSLVSFCALFLVFSICMFIFKKDMFSLLFAILSLYFCANFSFWTTFRFFLENDFLSLPFLALPLLFVMEFPILWLSYLGISEFPLFYLSQHQNSVMYVLLAIAILIFLYVNILKPEKALSMVGCKEVYSLKYAAQKILLVREIYSNPINMGYLASGTAGMSGLYFFVLALPSLLLELRYSLSNIFLIVSILMFGFVFSLLTYLVFAGKYAHNLLIRMANLISLMVCILYVCVATYGVMSPFAMTFPLLLWAMSTGISLPCSYTKLLIRNEDKSFIIFTTLFLAQIFTGFFYEFLAKFSNATHKMTVAAFLILITMQGGWVFFVAIVKRNRSYDVQSSN